MVKLTCAGGSSRPRTDTDGRVRRTASQPDLGGRGCRVKQTGWNSRKRDWRGGRRATCEVLAVSMYTRGQGTARVVANVIATWSPASRPPCGSSVSSERAQFLGPVL